MLPMQPSGLKSLKLTVKCDNKKQPGKVIFPKVLAQQLFLSMSGVATSRSIVFHDERCEHHSEQAPYQKLLGYRNPKLDTEIRKA